MKPIDRARVAERVVSYLSAMLPAVSGSGGHNAAYAAAHIVANGFALDEDTSLALLLAHYNPRCLPPWNEAELRHKVRDALANPDAKGRGYLLKAGEAAATFSSAPFAKSSEQVGREREQRASRLLAASARVRLPRLLASSPWSAVQIFSDSPEGVADDPAEDWRLLLSLYRSEDHLWIGDVRESGVRHANRFQSVARWLEGKACPKGPFILPAILKPGACSRTKTDVAGQPLLVIESDLLDKDESGAVFRWLREEVGLTLRAVVDTGSRSLHAWFVRPDAETLRELRIVLPALGFDGATLRETQPVRLPGCLRPGKNTRQAMLYFDRGVAR